MGVHRTCGEPGELGLTPMGGGIERPATRTGVLEHVHAGVEVDGGVGLQARAALLVGGDDLKERERCNTP